MIETRIWQVEVDATRGADWTGLFLFPPSPKHIKYALQLAFEAAVQVVEADDGDEEDAEQASYCQEQIHATYEVANHLPDDFMSHTGEQTIKVAGVQIGTASWSELDAFES